MVPMRNTVLALAAAFALPLGAGAQGVATPWAPWLGCWVSEQPSSAPEVTCVLPAEESAFGATIVSFVDGAETRRVAVIADGVARPVEAEGCSGWESARFSDDGDRVYLTGEVSCEENRPQQRTSGVYSISSAGAWVDVVSIKVGTQQRLRNRRLVLTERPGVPVEITSAIAARSQLAGGARIAASVPLTVERVIDASRALDPQVTELWMIETQRDAEFAPKVTAKELRALAAAGVPASIIDLTVAFGYPNAFVVGITAQGQSDVQATQTVVGGGGGPLYDVGPGYAQRGFYGPWGPPPECAYLSWGMMTAQERMACTPYGYGSPMFYGAFGSMFGPNAWYMPGWGFSNGFYNPWGRPIRVVVRPLEPVPGGGGGQPSRGRVVRGGGYTQSGGTPTGQTAQPRSSGTAAATSKGSSGASAPASKGSSSTERTAKPRKP
jgi:hypothetical protein